MTLPDFTHDNKNKIIAYDGNTALKPCKCTLDWTKEHAEEYLRCKNDWKYFAENYYHITSLDKGIIKVKTRYYQDNIINNFIDNRFNIILSSRQSGKSTSYEIFCLWYILFNEAKTIGILANKLETAVGILQKVKLAYELLPKWLQQGIKKWNEKSIELENKCKLICSATSSSAIRSKSVNVLILDECAFVNNKQWSKFYSSVYPTISSSQDSKIIIVSTPNGLNHFYKFWSEAIKGVDGIGGKGNKFIPYRVDWWEVPGRDEAWKLETIANMDNPRDFETEYNNNFLGSSLTLVETHTLNSLSSVDPIKIKFKIDDKYNQFIKIYETPLPEHMYVLGLDSSEMMQDSVGDSISMQILDVTSVPFKQVATINIREGITYFEVPDIAVAIANYYNHSTMFIEANSTGLEIANIIVNDFEYDNVFFGNKNGLLPGIKTTKKTKRLGCSNLKMLLEGQHLIIRDQETINQLSTFIKKGSSYAADSGFLDDAVMSLIVSLYFMNDKTSIEDLKDFNFVKRTIDENKQEVEEKETFLVVLPDYGDIQEMPNVPPPEWNWLFN